MNEKNLVKRIRQLGEQINILERSKMDDTLRKEHIRRNESLIKYYIRKLKDLKWKWLLKGGDIEDLLN